MTEFAYLALDNISQVAVGADLTPQQTPSLFTNYPSEAAGPMLDGDHKKVGNRFYVSDENKSIGRAYIGIEYNEELRPSGNLYVEIYSTDGGMPNALIATSEPFDASSAHNASTLVFEFASPVPANPYDTYVAVIRGDEAYYAGADKITMLVSPNDPMGWNGLFQDSADAWQSVADDKAISCSMRSSQPANLGNKSAPYNEANVKSLQLHSEGSLPAPSEELRGQFRIVKGGPGIADDLKVCMKGDDDNYYWKSAPLS